MLFPELLVPVGLVAAMVTVIARVDRFVFRLPSFSLFRDDELEMLIAGLPTIDVEDWLANTSYVTFDASSEVISWFWDVVREFSQVRSCCRPFVDPYSGCTFHVTLTNHLHPFARQCRRNAACFCSSRRARPAYLTADSSIWYVRVFTWHRF